MTKRLRSFGLASAALALTLAAAACSGSGDPSTDPTGEALSGEVNLDGSSTVGPIAEVGADLFEEEYPDVNVNVGVSGTGGGFEKFCRGETDISDASRAINEKEVAACEAGGVEYEQITVGNDALTVLVHPDNPIDCVTVEQLKDIYGPGSTISNWNEVAGIDWDQELTVYGPGPDSGTFGYFGEEINDDAEAMRTDGYNSIGENDNIGIQGIQGALGGIFYVGFTFYAENEGTVKALEIDGGDGCVAPSAATAQDGSYTPLSRGLYMYISADAVAKPQARAFIEFMINQNEEIAGFVNAIPLTSAQRQEMLTKVAGLAA